MKQAIAHAGVTQVALAKACGIKPPSVSDWLTGKTQTIEGSNLLRAASFLGVRAEWLADGRGKMTSDDVGPHTSERDSQATRLDVDILFIALTTSRKGFDRAGLLASDKMLALSIERVYLHLMRGGSEKQAAKVVADFLRRFVEGTPVLDR